MKRLVAGMLLLVLCGCQLPPERAPVQRLPENTPPMPYAELLTRARSLATAATEAFYVDKWADLEDAARTLEQTARFLAKAEDVPAKHKGHLTEMSAELVKDANRLLEAAQGKNVKATTDALQRVQSRIREMRLGD
jgi:hypothetical protein